MAVIRAALILALAAGAVEAGPHLRMTILPGDETCFAFVAVENRAGVYNAVEVLDTAHGPVSIAYRTVGSHTAGNADNADRVAVQELPPGVAAIPMQMDVLDGDTGIICLREYLGG